VTIKNLLQAADIKEVLTNAMLLEARAPCLALLKSRNAPPDAKFSHAHRADSTTVFSHLESFPHNRDVFATEPNSESQAEMFKCSSTLVTAYPAFSRAVGSSACRRQLIPASKYDSSQFTPKLTNANQLVDRNLSNAKHIPTHPKSPSPFASNSSAMNLLNQEKRSHSGDIDFVS
jgi:hypothetical protein